MIFNDLAVLFLLISWFSTLRIPVHHTSPFSGSGCPAVGPGAVMTFQTYRSKLLLVFFSWNSSTLDQLLVTWWKTISQKLFGFSDKFGFLSSVSLCLFIDLLWDGKEVFIFFTCSFKMLNFPVLYFFIFTNSGILLFWSVSHKLTVWSLGSCLDLTFPGHVLYDWLSLTYCCLSFSLLSPFFFCISFFFYLS